MTIAPASVTRLVLIGLIGGIIQLSAVSQIPIFGVPADLSPLLVCMVGFLAGSVPGAVFGFCLGCELYLLGRRLTTRATDHQHTITEKEETSA